LTPVQQIRKWVNAKFGNNWDGWSEDVAILEFAGMELDDATKDEEEWLLLFTSWYGMDRLVIGKTTIWPGRENTSSNRCQSRVNHCFSSTDPSNVQWRMKGIFSFRGNRIA
jgi:hypothetical protein